MCKSIGNVTEKQIIEYDRKKHRSNYVASIDKGNKKHWMRMEERIAPPLQCLCKLVLPREFGVGLLQLTAVEHPADVLEGFLGSKPASRNQLQGCQ